VADILLWAALVPAAAVLNVLGFPLATFLHELGHALAAKLVGVRVHEVNLMRVRLDIESSAPWRQRAVALGGPMASLAVLCAAAAAAWACWTRLDGAWAAFAIGSMAVPAVVSWKGFADNLVPRVGLDGATDGFILFRNADYRRVGARLLARFEREGARRERAEAARPRRTRRVGPLVVELKGAP